MSSSESAQAVLLALWAVAALTFASAQWRVMRAPDPRRRRYVIAWLACTLIIGTLLSLMDGVTGRVEWSRRFANALLAGIVAVAGLGAGAWLTHRPLWVRWHPAARFLTLVLLHAVVLLLVGFPLL